MFYERLTYKRHEIPPIIEIHGMSTLQDSLSTHNKIQPDSLTKLIIKKNNACYFIWPAQFKL